MRLKLSRRFLFVTASLLLGLLTEQSAFSEDILLSRNISLSVVQKLKPQEVSNDLDILVSTLESAYGGKGILPENQYHDFLIGLNKLKEYPNDISSLEFCNLVADQIEMLNDYHLTAQIEDLTCSRQWPIPTVGANSGFLNTNQTWSLMYKENKNKFIAVLAIKKMTPASSPEWTGFLETVQGLIESGNSFVIDLRQNPGGDFTMPYEMARLLYGLNKDKSVPMPKKQTYRRSAADAWALLANSFWLNMQSYKDKTLPVPDYLSSSYQAMVGYHQMALARNLTTIEIENLGTDSKNLSHPVSFPIYVLIDRNCGSSCELTLEALENLPAIETVGENTTGVVQFGNVGTLYLPASHVVIQIPTQGSVYSDGRRVEKIGYAPRWKVQHGRDALEYTLNQFF